MRASYEDLYELAGDRKPLWHDINGVPRFRPHHPKLAPNIYARECALVQIACQDCRRRIPVQFTSNLLDKTTLRERIVGGAISYGDPPYHLNDEGEYCHCGCTMTSDALAVLEFWRRDEEWERDPEVEIVIQPG